MAKSAADYMLQFNGYSENNPEQAAALAAFIKQNAGINIDPATTAWCAAFLNAALSASGSPTQKALTSKADAAAGRNTSYARDFANWGTAVDQPQPGDIVVMSRPGGGHVGIFMGSNPDGTINVLSGNHSDSVNVDKYSTANVLSYRRGGEGYAQAAMAGQVPDPTGLNAQATYTVQRGDTLAKIAAQQGTTVDALAKANGISDPNVIKAGQVLHSAATQPQLPIAPMPMPSIISGGYDGTKQMVSYQPFPSKATINPDAAVQAAKDAGVISGAAAMVPNGMIWSGGFGQKGMGDTIAQQVAASGSGTFDTKSNVLTISPETMSKVTAGYNKIPAPFRDMFGTNPGHYITNNPNIAKVATVTPAPKETFPLPIPRPNIAPSHPVPPLDISVPQAQPLPSYRVNASTLGVTPPLSFDYRTPSGPLMPTKRLTPPLDSVGMEPPPITMGIPQPAMSPVKYTMSDLMGTSMARVPLPAPAPLAAPSTLSPLPHRNVPSAPNWQSIAPPVSLVQLASGRMVPNNLQGQRNGQGYAVQKDGSILHSGGWSTPGPSQPQKWWQINSAGGTV